MSISLRQLLELVTLDDSGGEDSGRERFRRFLAENAPEAGQVRDYIQECLRESGDQYNRALQDLVNHVGQLLGFDVTFGRYRGITREIGFDGQWRSPTGFHLVLEVKTTDVYTVSTSVLVGYVDQLISSSQIPSWASALGLYVLGRPGEGRQQLEASITAEGRATQLRTISAESLLSLAEMVAEYDVSHEDVLSVLQPSGPGVDSVVDLMAGLVAQRASETELAEVRPSPPGEPTGEPSYWLTPVKGNEQDTAEEVIAALVGEARVYAFGDRTPGRRRLREGDWIAFYATGSGVVAHAQVASSPQRQTHPRVRDPNLYPWTFELRDPVLYLDRPVVIDAALRANLEEFRDRDPNRSWAWFVQATRRVSGRDFALLTQPGAS